MWGYLTANYFSSSFLLFNIIISHRFCGRRVGLWGIFLCGVNLFFFRRQGFQLFLQVFYLLFQLWLCRLWCFFRCFHRDNSTVRGNAHYGFIFCVGSYDACHVGAVTVVIVAVAFFSDNIYAIIVIDVAVVIIVYAVVCCFSCVFLDVLCQVFVVIVHTCINYGHNNSWVAAFFYSAGCSFLRTGSISDATDLQPYQF